MVFIWFQNFIRLSLSKSTQGRPICLQNTNWNSSKGHTFFLKNCNLLNKNVCLVLGTIGFENASGVVPHQAGLYKISKENIANPTTIKSAVTNSNGIAWNKANDKIFYIDTPTLKIVEFDFDVETGNISSK